MKKFFSKEIMIALLVIAAMVLLFIGIEFLKGVNVFKAANYYYARYDNVTGLAQSASVTLNGFKVGQVREIQYEYNNPGHVLVELSLNRDLKLPEGTQALLQTDLLGTASIGLVLGDGTQYIEVGDTLDASVPKGLMDNVSQEVLPQLGTVFTKVDTLLTSINAIVGNEALLASVQRLDAITANLERTTVQLNALMATLPPITANVGTITGELAQASANVNTLTADLNNVPLDSIAENVRVLSENLRALSEQLNDPNSTIGMLTNDPTLYNNLSSAVANLDSLFVDIKRNPKRYISIKLL